jgi:hypothetical protein
VEVFVEQDAIERRGCSSLFDHALLAFEFHGRDVVTGHLHLLEPGGQCLLTRGLHDTEDFPLGQVQETAVGPHGRIALGRLGQLVHLLALQRAGRHRVAAHELRHGRFSFQPRG